MSATNSTGPSRYFWRSTPAEGDWLAELRDLTEPDGIRILNHRLLKSGASQFLVSTKPRVIASDIPARIKGRLQHLIRSRAPKAFQRNYSLRTRSMNVDLSARRFTAHAQYWYNLHVVLENDGGWRETNDGTLRAMVAMLRAASRKKRHLLSRAGIAPDHLHFTLGCHPQESPLDVALSYMNNLAIAAGMR